MFAKPLVADRGTQRALLVTMNDADLLEGINCDQVATATDRLLLRAAHAHRVAYPGRPPGPVHYLAARGSEPAFNPDELTVHVLSRRGSFPAARPPHPPHPGPTAIIASSPRPPRWVFRRWHPVDAAAVALSAAVVAFVTTIAIIA